MADLYFRKDGVDSCFIRGVDLIPTGRVDIARFGTSQVQRGEERFLLTSREGWDTEKDDLFFVRNSEGDIWIDLLSWTTKQLKDGTHYIWVVKANQPE